MKTTVIKINGTHCKSCKLLIEDVCQDIKGVKLCWVDFQTGKTFIEHDEHFNLDTLKQAVEGFMSISSRN